MLLKGDHVSEELGTMGTLVYGVSTEPLFGNPVPLLCS
jgi:hypothetical protein